MRRRRILSFEGLELRRLLAVNIAAVRPDFSQVDKLLHVLLDTEQFAGIRNDQPEILFHFGKSSQSANPGGINNISQDDVVIAGDWSGLGVDLVGVVRTNEGLNGGQFILDTDRDPGHDYEFVFGDLGDTPLVGNFDGKNGDDVAVVNSSVTGLSWRLSYAKSAPSQPFPTDISRVDTDADFFFGDSGDRPLTGDFDSDGRADLIVVRDTGTTLEWYLTFASSLGSAYPTDGRVIEMPTTPTFIFSKSSTGLLHTPITGDWDGDGSDNFGVVIDGVPNTISQWQLDTPTGPIAINYGLAGDKYITGNWPDVLWDAGAADRRWGTPENWSDDRLPSNGETVAIVQSVSDVINFDAGDFSGELRTSNQINVTGGTLTLQDESSVDVLNVTAGTVILDGSTRVNRLVVSGGTVTFQGTGSIGDVLISGGTLIANQVVGATVFQMTSGLLQFGISNPFNNIDLTLSGGRVENTATLLRLDNPIILRNTVGFIANESFSLGREISGDGTFEKLGPSFINLEAVNSYSGSTIIRQGELLVSQPRGLRDGNTVFVEAGALLNLEERTAQLGSLTGTGNVQIRSPGTLTIGVNDAISRFDGTIVGDGGLNKIGSGTFTLGGVNAYSGNTTISGGIVALAVNNSLPSQSPVSIAPAARLELISSNVTIDSLSGNGLLDVGSGALTLSSQSTIGQVRIGGGRLIANANFTASEIIFAATGGELTTELPNATNGDTVRIASNIALNGAAKLGGVGYLIIDGVITGSGSLEKIGIGSVLLATAHSYSGVTTITEGILVAENSSSLGSSIAGTIVNGGVLALGGDGAPLGFEVREPIAISAVGRLDLLRNINVIEPLTLAGTILGDVGSSITGDIVLTSNATLTQRSSSGILRLLGAITDAAQSHGIIIDSPSGGSVELTSSLNSYLGATRVRSGILTTSTSGAIPDLSDVFIARGATLRMANITQRLSSLSGDGTIEIDAGALVLTTTSSSSFAGQITGSGNLIKRGTGILTLSGASSFAGTTTIEAGELAIEGSGQRGAIAVRADASFRLEGTGTVLSSLVVDGFGTAVLGGSNSTIASLIANGLVQVVASGTNVTSITIGQNGILRVQRPIVASPSSSIVIDGGLIEFEVNDPFLDVPITVRTNGATFTAKLANGGSTFNNPITLEFNPTVTFGWVGAGSPAIGLTYRGAITGSGILRKRGANFLNLVGRNTFTGPVNVQAGELRLGIPDTLPLSAAVDISTGALLNLSVNTVQLATISGLGTIQGDSGSQLTVGGTNLPSTFAGTLAGALSLTKAGSSSVTLSGINTYSGSTTIFSGVLEVAVSNSIPTTSKTAVSSAGQIRISDASQMFSSLTGNGSVVLDDAVLILTPSSSTVFAGTIAGNGSVTKRGSAALTLSGAVNFVGTSFVEAGEIDFQGSGSQLSNVQVRADATARFSGTNSSVSQLTVDALGTAVLSSPSSDVTNLNVNGLIVVSESGSNINQIAIGSNGILRMQGEIATVPTSAISINGGTIEFETNEPFLNVPITVTANGATFTAKLANGGSTFNNPIALQTNATATFDWVGAGSSSVGFAYRGVITGEGSLRKRGANFLNLTGVSNFTGPVNVDQGELRLGLANALPSSAFITLQPSALLNLSTNSVQVAALAGTGSVRGDTGSQLSIGGSNIDSTFAGSLIGSLTLEKQGTGTLTLAGNNTYSGQTTVQSGTLSVAANNSIPTTSVTSIAAQSRLQVINSTQLLRSLSGQGTIDLSLGTLILDATIEMNFAGPVVGSGAFIKRGSNSLTLTGVNRFTGTTDVESGELVLQGNDTQHADIQVRADASITISAASSTIGSLSVNSIGSATISGTATTINTLLVDGLVVVSGNGSRITQTTIGQNGILRMQAVTGDSASSVLDINGGIIEFEVNEPFADAPIVVGANGATFIAKLASGGSRFSSPISLQTDGIAIFDWVGAGSSTIGFTYGGEISGSGSLRKRGANFLSLTGSSSFSGKVAIEQGELRLGISNALPPTASVSVAAGTLLNLSTNTVSLASVSGSGNIQGEAGSQLTLGESNLSSEFDGTLTGALALIKQGSGSLTLNNSNSYSGTTTVAAGVLLSTVDDGLPSTSSVLIASEAEVNFGNTISNLASIDNSGTVRLGTDERASLSVLGSINNSLSGNFLLSGATLTIGGDLISFGVLESASSSLTLNGTLGTTQTILFAEGITSRWSNLVHSGASDVVFNSPLEVANSIRKSGLGSFDVNGQTINTSRLTLDSGALVDSQRTGSIVATDSFELRAGRVATVLRGDAGITKSGEGEVTIAAENVYQGQTQVSQGRLVLGGPRSIPNTSSVNVEISGFLHLSDHSISVRSLAGDGQVELGSGTLTLLLDTDSTFGGIISGSGSLTIQGSATLSLAGQNTYEGITQIETGTLRLVGSNPLARVSDVSIDTEGTLDLESSQQTIRSVQGLGTLTFAGGTLIVSNGAEPVHFGGFVQGSGTFVNETDGLLSLSGSGGFSGVFEIRNGTFDANGRFPFASAFIQDGANMQGSGALGDVTVNFGGTLRPGSSPGLLTVRNLDLNEGSKLVFEIGGLLPGDQYDQVAVSKHAVLNGEIVVELIDGFAPWVGEAFDLIRYESFSGTPLLTFVMPSGTVALREEQSAAAYRLVSFIESAPPPQSTDGGGTNTPSNGQETFLLPSDGLAGFKGDEEFEDSPTIYVSASAVDTAIFEADATEWFEQSPEYLPIEPAMQDESLAIEMAVDAVYANESLANLSSLASDMQPNSPPEISAPDRPAEFTPEPEPEREPEPTFNHLTTLEIAAGTALFLSGLVLLAASILKPRKTNPETIPKADSIGSGTTPESKPHLREISARQHFSIVEEIDHE